MFEYSIQSDTLTMVYNSSLEKQFCSIGLTNGFDRFSFPDTVLMLQKLFSLNQILTVGEPYCDLQTHLSFHGFVALVYQNVCSLSQTSMVNDFLDSLFQALAKINIKRTKCAAVVDIKSKDDIFEELLGQLSFDNLDYKCKKCGLKLEDGCKLNRHVITIHLGVDNWKMLDPEVAQELYCSVCCQQFYDLSGYKFHLKICCANDSVLDLKSYIERTARKREQDQFLSNFCGICERTLPCKNNFLEHLKDHASEQPLDPSHFECVGNSCLEETNLSTSHNAQLFLKLQQSDMKEFYNCEECGLTSLHARAYKHHMTMLHIGLDVLSLLNSSFTPEACGNCMVEFADNNHKEVHMSRCSGLADNAYPLLSVEKLNEYREFIESSAERRDLLVSQMMGLRCSEEILKEPRTSGDCRMDDMSVNKSDSKKRKETRKKRENVRIACPLCDKVYMKHYGLKVHIATFHNKEKKFSCDDCEKKFGRMDSLVKHKLTHTLEKNFICEFCSRAFSQSSNLVKHRRLQHLDADKESMRFRCTVCPSRYYSSNELAKHVKISHEKLKDHRCLLCDGHFGGRAIVRRHIKKVHRVEDPQIDKDFKKLFDILESC